MRVPPAQISAAWIKMDEAAKLLRAGGQPEAADAVLDLKKRQMDAFKAGTVEDRINDLFGR